MNTLPWILIPEQHSDANGDPVIQRIPDFCAQVMPFMPPPIEWYRATPIRIKMIVDNRVRLYRLREGKATYRNCCTDWARLLRDEAREQLPVSERKHRGH